MYIFVQRNIYIIRQKQGRTAFIEYDLAIGDVLSPIYTLLFDLALKEALGRTATQGNVYLIADELKLLPNLRHLEDGINFGRSLGVKILAGLQSIDQLNANYANETKARNAVSGFSSVFAFQQNDYNTREYVSQLMGRNMDFVNHLLEKTGFSADNVDVVLLVGGSTKMPMVRAAVEAMFPGKVRVEDPDLAVAKGAALAAAIEWNERLQTIASGGEVKPDYPTNDEEEPISNLPTTAEEAAALMINVPQQVSTVSDKLTRSLGPAVYVDEEHYMIDNLLFVGDEIPAEAEAVYGTRTDNQAEIKVKVFENVATDRENKHEMICYSMLAVCICVLYNRFCTRKSSALLACLSFGFAILFTFLVFLLNNWWRYLYENTRFYWNFQNGWYWPFSAVLKSDIKYSIGIGKYRYWLVFFAAEIGLLVEMVSMREVSKKSKPSI